jgi:hypothetical protein
MSDTTSALIKGVKQMLKNRGSLTVKEVQLLRNVVTQLKKHERLKGDEKLRNGVTVVEFLIRFLLNPGVSENLSQIASNLIDKLI